MYRMYSKKHFADESLLVGPGILPPENRLMMEHLARPRFCSRIFIKKSQLTTPLNGVFNQKEGGVLSFPRRSKVNRLAETTLQFMQMSSIRK